MTDQPYRYRLGGREWIPGLEREELFRSSPGTNALSHTRYRDVVENDEFLGDYDQRHTVNAYAQYRWSHRMSISALFRDGSTFPLVGYYEKRDGVLYVWIRRNTERLEIDPVQQRKLERPGSRCR